MSMYYSSPDFEAEYTYHGNDLGATFSPDKTRFRLWAPTADAVCIQLYRGGNAGVNDALFQIPMKRDIKGTPIVIVLASTFAEYLYNHIFHEIRDIDYKDFDDIIVNNLGTDISQQISDLTLNKFATN